MSQPEGRKRKLADKPPTPEVYKASLDLARERSLKRRHGPIIEIEAGSGELLPPFADHGDDWHYIVVDAFGTRSHDVAAVFIHQLAGLVRSTFDDASKEWVPDPAELTTLLHIVAADRPKNEAEAMLAAQIAAAHMLTMKVAERAARYNWDDKTLSSFSKLARASAALVDTMQGLKGRRKSTSHKITVRTDRHVHQHIHYGEPPCENLRQSQGTEREAPSERAALLGEGEGNRTIVPLSGREGQARVSGTRG